MTILIGWKARHLKHSGKPFQLIMLSFVVRICVLFQHHGDPIVQNGGQEETLGSGATSATNLHPRAEWTDSNAFLYVNGTRRNNTVPKSKLVRLGAVQHGNMCMSFTAQLLAIISWLSLIWMPILTVCTLIRLLRGSSPSVGIFLLCLLAVYMVPFLPASLGHANTFWLRCFFSWFDNVEIWAAEETLHRPCTTPTLMCYHPHGVLSVGLMALPLVADRLFPDGVVVLSAPYIKWGSPILQVATRFLSPVPFHLEDVSKDSIHRVLAGKSDTVIMVPGGMQEATLSKRGHERIFLQHRKGFVKYALQHGYSLTPIYAFGETDLFYNLQAGMALRLRLNEGILGSTQGFPTVLPSGWKYLPLLPKPAARLRVVVGPPLKLPRIAEPRPEDVERWHKNYLQAVQRLYYATVHLMGSPSRKLEIF